MRIDTMSRPLPATWTQRRTVTVLAVAVALLAVCVWAGGALLTYPNPAPVPLAPGVRVLADVLGAGSFEGRAPNRYEVLTTSASASMAAGPALLQGELATLERDGWRPASGAETSLVAPRNGRLAGLEVVTSAGQFSSDGYYTLPSRVIASAGHEPLVLVTVQSGG